MPQINKHPFDSFTNLYSLSKTLRFELKPIPETDTILKKLGIWYTKDAKKAKEKPIVKFYMDIFHREFTEEALKKTSLDLNKFFKLFLKLKRIQNQSAQTKEDKKFKENNVRDKKNEIKNEFNELAKKFKEAYDQTDQNWRKMYKKDGQTIKNENSKTYTLLSENILNYLKNRFSQKEVERLRKQDNEYADQYNDVVDSDGEIIFDNFKGFFGYFDSLINNRANFYKIDGKAARISTRAANENLSFFAENIYIFKTSFADTLSKEITKKENAIFEENFYNSCLLQAGIKYYNFIIGNINKKINKYNQQNDKKIPFLKNLYKQILSLEDKEDYKHIEINDDSDLIAAIEEFMQINSNKIIGGKKIFSSFISRCLSNDNLDQIYLPKDSMNTIAYRIFKQEEDIMELYKNKYFVSIQGIEKLTKSDEWQKMDMESKEKEKQLVFKDSVSNLISFSDSIFTNFIKILENEYNNQFKGFEKETRRGKRKFVGYNEALNNLKEKLQWFKDKKAKKEKIDKEEKIEWIKTVKDYSDVALRIFQMTKYLWLPVVGDEDDKDYQKIKAEIETLLKDQNFYNQVDNYVIGYEPFVYRSSFQEYLTRKPFSEDKFKINFDNGSLLKGWDKDKIHERLGVILRKDDQYFLGIIDKTHRHCLDDLNSFRSDDSNSYSLMQFKQLSGLYRQLPRIAFPKKKISIVDAGIEVKKIKEEFDKFQDDKKEHLISSKAEFDNHKLNVLIDYYRRFIKEYYKDEKCYDFSSLKEGKKYKNLNDFYADVDKITYSLTMDTKINIDNLIKEGKMLLFQIYNKDFSKSSLGKSKNLQSYYFKALFDLNESIKGRVRLGAEAEIFYRPASLVKLNQKKEVIITKENNKEIKKDRNPYHIKRYSENKIFLHLPIQLNADTYTPNDVNSKVLDYIANENSIRIIGIDRGEKNLAYYSVLRITPEGKTIVEDCGDLNLGYLEPLDKLEKERQEQRKTWQSISEIKSKRNGYISHAVHKIANLVLNHKAIVVFEDLSGGFKRSRIKIEKAPYQQLELALINKLNYLVKKNEQAGKPGHYLSAYQLTEQVGSYKDIGKQTGIIFYTQAGYTSRTCPQCGWRKRIQGLQYKNLETAKKLFDPYRGVQVSFNGDEFVFKYLVMYERKSTKDWDKEAYSNISRVRWSSKDKKYITYNIGEITKKLKSLFENNKMDLKQNINEEIQSINERNFWEKLIYLLNLILEIRNTDSELDCDYIECPHCHFHSDKGFQGHKWNGDANGAYNIARKGLMIMSKIRKEENTENIKWGDIKIDIKEWDKAVTDWDAYVAKGA